MSDTPNRDGLSVFGVTAIILVMYFFVILLPALLFMQYLPM